MKRIPLKVIAILTAILTACSAFPLDPADVEMTSPGQSPVRQTLVVLAAASLTDAFNEIGQAFEAAHPGVGLEINYGSSHTLRIQLEQGAAADVFASANPQEMLGLIEAGLVEPDAPRVFLTNRLVVIMPADNPAGIRLLADLARPGLKLVLAAEEVPAGKYARQALEKMNARLGADFSPQVLANVVSNEDNVKQVVAKVKLGEADAGIVYASDGIAADTLQTIPIPAEMNVVAAYPIAVLKNAGHPELAAAFVETVLSAQGQAILLKWGFAPAEP